MSFFIADAWAAAPTASPTDPIMSFLPLILIFAVFYFLLIRPQSKRAKELKQMITALAKGDEVVTTGGLLGKVTEVGETFIAVEIADGVQVKVQKNAVAGLMPKGTIKAL
jgi:preprotein translocase subunit YajC